MHDRSEIMVPLTSHNFNIPLISSSPFQSPYSIEILSRFDPDHHSYKKRPKQKQNGPQAVAVEQFKNPDSKTSNQSKTLVSQNERKYGKGGDTRKQQNLGIDRIASSRYEHDIVRYGRKQKNLRELLTGTINAFEIKNVSLKKPRHSSFVLDKRHLSSKMWDGDAARTDPLGHHVGSSR